MDILEKKENIMEVNEAIIAGKRAFTSLKKAKDELSHAENWIIWDKMDGSLFAKIVKHSKMENAAQEMEDTREQLQIFQEELRDVEVSDELTLRVDDFLTFSGFFFEGLISDWLVQARISEAREEIDVTLDRVETMVCELQKWEKESLRKGKE